MTQVQNPLLSIVIASYNSAELIGACLDSLRREFDARVEVLLIDGGSRDDTVKIAETYTDVLSVIVSEPDKGQSDAFNKGFHRARGKYLTWLNSDDVICSGALRKALNALEHSKADWLTANCLYIDKGGDVTRCCRSGGFESFALKYGLLNVFGPSTFFTKELFTRFGPFREDFHYCMDTEYWWRIASSNVQYKRIPCYFWGLRLHDNAKTASAITGDFSKRPQRMQEEGKLIRETYYKQQTPISLKKGVLLVRLYRILNGSYIRSLCDTLRFRGRAYNHVKA